MPIVDGVIKWACTNMLAILPSVLVGLLTLTNWGLVQQMATSIGRVQLTGSSLNTINMFLKDQRHSKKIVKYLEYT